MADVVTETDALESANMTNKFIAGSTKSTTEEQENLPPVTGVVTRRDFILGSSVWQEGKRAQSVALMTTSAGCAWQMENHSNDEDLLPHPIIRTPNYQPGNWGNN